MKPWVDPAELTRWRVRKDLGQWCVMREPFVFARVRTKAHAERVLAVIVDALAVAEEMAKDGAVW